MTTAEGEGVCGGRAEGEGLLRRPRVSCPGHRHRLRLGHFLSACLQRVEVRATFWLRQGRGGGSAAAGLTVRKGDAQAWLGYGARGRAVAGVPSHHLLLEGLLVESNLGLTIVV